MRTSNCLICCATGRTEGHHVAGWRNDPDLVVDLCTDCHRIVTSWQHAAGIRLKRGHRHHVDIARARAVGTLHLLELFMHRHPGVFALPPTAPRVLGRLVSVGLDGAADPARPGRWTPDPTEGYPTVVAATNLSDQERAEACVRFESTFAELMDRVGMDDVAAELGWSPDWRKHLSRTTTFAAIVVAVACAVRPRREVAA
jgi:hypothetical protein